MDKLYTVADLCERYQVKDFTVWDWIRNNKLAASKIGKQYYIKEKDLIAFEEKAKK